MNENAIGKEAVDGANLTKDGIERIVTGLPEQNLGVLGSWRESRIRVEPVVAADVAPPHR